MVIVSIFTNWCGLQYHAQSGHEGELKTDIPQEVGFGEGHQGGDLPQAVEPVLLAADLAGEQGQGLIRATRTTAASAPTRMVYSPMAVTLSPAVRKRRRFPSNLTNRVENRPARMVLLKPQNQNQSRRGFSTKRIS
jgi:hypothetical protein